MNTVRQQRPSDGLTGGEMTEGEFVDPRAVMHFRWPSTVSGASKSLHGVLLEGKMLMDTMEDKRAVTQVLPGQLSLVVCAIEQDLWPKFRSHPSCNSVHRTSACSINTNCSLAD